MIPMKHAFCILLAATLQVAAQTPTLLNSDGDGVDPAAFRSAIGLSAKTVTLVAADDFERTSLGDNLTGHTYTTSSPTGNTPILANGELYIDTSSATANEPRAYPRITLASQPAAAGAEIRWRQGPAAEPNANTAPQASFVLLLDQDNAGTFDDGLHHLVVDRDGWVFQTGGTSGGFTTHMSGNFEPDLPADGSPVIVCLEISGTTATVEVGLIDSDPATITSTDTTTPAVRQRCSVTDAAIGTNGGPVVIWEPYYYSNTYPVDSFTDVYISRAFAAASTTSDRLDYLRAVTEYADSASAVAVAGVTPDLAARDILGATRSQVLERTADPDQDLLDAFRASEITRFEIAGITTSDSGSEASSDLSGSRLLMSLTASATTSDWVWAQISPETFSHLAAGTLWSDKTIRIGFQLEASTAGDDTLTIQIGRDYNESSVGELDDPGMGFEKDGDQIIIKAHDGASLTTSSAYTLAQGANQRYEFILESDGFGNVTLYGRHLRFGEEPLKVMLTTDGGPEGTGGTLNSLLECFVEVDTNHSSSRNHKVFNLWGQCSPRW